MSYSEFPHTNYSDHDHIELIRLYQKLVSDYSGTLEEIKAVTARLDKYEKDMDAKILDIESRAVPAAVNRAVQDAMYQYQQDVNNRINNLNIRISTVENMYDSIQSSIDSAVAGVSEEIDELRDELTRKTGALQTQINEFNNAVNVLSDKFVKLETSVTVTAGNIYSSMDELRRETTETVNKAVSDNEKFVVDELVAFRDIFKGDIGKLRNELLVNDSLIYLRAGRYTDSKVSALHTLIESLNLASNQQEIKWVWQYGCCFGGYNAIQWYNETPITCEDWNRVGISCVDWYVRGREIFGWFEHQRFMFSPVSGEYVDVRVALMELAAALKINGLTAEEYDGLGFTAEEYDSYRETAVEYDWNGRSLLNV